MGKFKLPIIIFSLLFLLGLGFYIYTLRKLAVDANVLFGKRCTQVNPSLIAYKKAFMNFSIAAKDPKKFTVDEMAKFYMDYFDGMKKYYPLDTEWLTENEKFMARRDYQLFMPWYMKKAADLQQKMYTAYRDEAQILSSFTEKGADIENLKIKFNEARERRNKYSDEYFTFSDEAYKIGDLRMLIQSVPSAPGCADENTEIPDTTGALDIPVIVPKEKSDITG